MSDDQFDGRARGGTGFQCSCIDCRTRRGEFGLAYRDIVGAAPEPKGDVVGPYSPLDGLPLEPSAEVTIAEARGRVARAEALTLAARREEIEQAVNPGGVLELVLGPERLLEMVNGCKPHLPYDAEARKAIPVATGFIDYFPDAIAAVAALSKVGNDQHNPGEPLHWAKDKSTDEADTLMRHFLDRGTYDRDGVRHSTKVAWRALALLQREIEADRS